MIETPTKQQTTHFVLHPGKLSIDDLKLLTQETTHIHLDAAYHDDIKRAKQVINDVLAADKIVYGINTGFGALAHTRINNNDLDKLQYKIVLSHACGTGELLHDDCVRLMLALKINSLARGHSGVTLETIEALIALYNAQIYPCIPCQGSVGASGDLAPLAHMALILIGEGYARHKNNIITAHQALDIIKRRPLTLGAKEGLALLNGTQASTALALLNWIACENLLHTALIAGALSVDAAAGSHAPFDARIHEVRGHQEQITVARILRELLANSGICTSHINCSKVQDPYSLRCQPQVMGACLSQLNYAKKILVTEANAVSDNPLIFANDQAIISGGNFHAEPVAFVADALAICIAEIGALSERRIALLIDPHFSQLPAFLVKEPGLNSGFMMAQVTAASLASENKSLAHPASIDSIPTSANQEDHVSMATFAARRLYAMVANTTGIVAIELLAACQGLDFRAPLKTSKKLQQVHAYIRSKVAHYGEDRYFSPDITTVKNLISSTEFAYFLPTSQ